MLQALLLSAAMRLQPAQLAGDGLRPSLTLAFHSPRSPRSMTAVRPMLRQLQRARIEAWKLALRRDIGRVDQGS